MKIAIINIHNIEQISFKRLLKNAFLFVMLCLFLVNIFAHIGAHTHTFNHQQHDIHHHAENLIKNNLDIEKANIKENFKLIKNIKTDKHCHHQHSCSDQIVKLTTTPALINTYKIFKFITLKKLFIKQLLIDKPIKPKWLS